VGCVDVAQAPGHRGDVDRGVATTHHHHPFANVAKATVVEGLQKGGGGDAVGRVGPVHRQGASSLSTQAQEHRIELGANGLHADVGANATVHARGHTQVEDALDLGIQHIAWRAKARNAVAHHAAQLGALVEQRNGVALARQLVGGRQAGRAAADDGHLLAGLRQRLGKGQLVLDGIVAQEVFHRVDANKVFHLVAVAARLTRRRADPAHHRRKRVGLGQTPKRIGLPAHACRRLLDATHDVEVAPDVLAGRATALARCGALDVGGALVRVAGIEDVLLEGAHPVVAVFVAAKVEWLGGEIFERGRHVGVS
jgi:hypothetical protein